MPTIPPLANAPAETTTAFGLSEAVLLDAVTAIAGAGSRLEVAAAVTAALMDAEGVRAAAVLQRHGEAALVVGSAGYACDTMAVGAALPLDSGLPAVRAIKAGQVVVQGTGPSWCATPFGHRPVERGALLISLTAPPPDGIVLARLQRVAAAVGSGLARAEQSDRTAAELSALLGALSAAQPADGAGIAIRQSARGGELGGDVALTVSDARGRWLVLADVSGAGVAAAGRAVAMGIAARALVPAASGPAHLLELLDRAVRPQTPEDGFVTAVVAHVQPGLLRVASAGHLAPILLTARGPVLLPVEPAPPLALSTAERLPTPAELVTRVPESALLVLYTDGLVDRRTAGGSELEIRCLLAAADDASAPADVADALIAAADAAGPADDDTAVVVSRL